MIPAVPIASFLLLAVIGARIAARGAPRHLLWVLIVLALWFGFSVGINDALGGYPGIYLAMTGYLLALPGMAGLLCGALLGWILRRHRARV